MIIEHYRASLFWLLLAVIFCAFLAATGLIEEAAGARGRGLQVVQAFFRWLLVEPMGLAGSIVFVMVVGAFAAFLVRPKL